MSKKIIQNIFIVAFFIIFSYFYGGDFLEYHQEKKEAKLNEISVSSSVENFSLENIKDFEYVEFYFTPDKNLLETVVNKINSAKKRVYIEIYMLTETRIINSIKRAKERGLDVKVILEKNPYMSPMLNNKANTSLLESGVEVVWSNPKNYSLNHSKLILIDDEIVLSTGNLSYSTFSSNKDLFLFIQDTSLLTVLEKIFLSDFYGKKVFIYHNNLVLSPNYSRDKLEKFILSAKKNISLYFPYIKDDLLEDILIDRVNSGIEINILVGKDFYEDDREVVEYLEENGIKIRYLDKYKMHSKAILIDGKYLFIGSINFSEYSLDKNREFGVILDDYEIINKFLKAW